MPNGKICYLEIPTTDIPRSVHFYQAVFGWQTRQRGDGATAFDDGVGAVSGSWVTGRPSSPSPGLLLYVMVDSITESLKQIVNAGRTWSTASPRRLTPLPHMGVASSSRSASMPRKRRHVSPIRMATCSGSIKSPASHQTLRPVCRRLSSQSRS